MNKLLLVVAAIFLISIIVGYIRGFLKIALSLAITIASIFLVTAITPHISGWIQESTSIAETVQNKLMEMFEMSNGTSADMLSSIEASSEQQDSLIKEAGLPSVIQEMLLENNNNVVYEALGVTSFVDYIGAYITKLIADIIAFLVAWIAVTIIARVLMAVIGIVGKIPVIGGVNRIAGGVVGIGIGLIIVWILFVLVTLLYNTAIGQACMKDIAASQILTKLYDGNVLMKFITKF